jgi:Fic family protein
MSDEKGFYKFEAVEDLLLSLLTETPQSAEQIAEQFNTIQTKNFKEGKIEEIQSISGPTARKYLDHLAELGKIKRIVTDANARFYYKEPMNDSAESG